MSGGSGSGEYWPGFVDALTNVVIAMVFVIVVLAIALSFAMQMVASRMAGKVAELEQAKSALMAAAASAATGPPAVAAAAAAVSTDTPLAAPADNRIRIAVAGNERQMPARPAQVKPADRSLVLEYELGALTLDEVAQKGLIQALGPVKSALQTGSAGTRIALVATGPAMELSDNQRAAFVRVMAVRNQLLDQGVGADRIVTRIDANGPGDKPRVALTLETAP